MVNPIESELEILKFWNEKKIFEKSLEQTKAGKPYIFYDGPPFATGLPHYGHLLASTLKDTFPRYFTMKGRYVKRTWGWDCHGLPVESIAEKELGLKSKDDIVKMGVKKFNDYCRKIVLRYANDWKKYIHRLGRWVDWDSGYKTMDTNYIESVWWAFKSLHKKGYLYEGEKILLYCPHCATPLAKSEIAMDNSYKNIKDLTVTVKFKLLNEENTYALAWTTTPWTLPGNLALAVNPKLKYAYVKDKNDTNTYLIARDLIQNFYKSDKDYTITKEVMGKDLENIEYEPLFPYLKDNSNSFKFLLGDFVNKDEGTGIVHISPMFGEDDNNVARKYNIIPVDTVDEKGNFKDIVTDYKGEFVHNITEKIAIDLKKAGKAISTYKMEHEYPFCYRCDTKLMYRALPAWFVDIQKIKNKLIKLNLKINWFPEYLKEGRMQHNITTAPDWNVTRNRYWATAIPIWKSPSGKFKILGSILELEKLSGKKITDLHKDKLDSVKFKINGEIYTRIPEVLDCWFESGAMTFAQFHYPFENKKYFEDNFPAQFVVEYIGQTRAWFYYMITLSAILFDKIPFENVLTTGTIMAEDGSKMSKSLNNYPDPINIIEKYSADSLRFYMISSPLMNAENFNFSEEGVKDTYKKIISLLYNVSNFYSDYQTNKDKIYKVSSNLIDKWIISKIEKLNYEVDKYLEEYNTVKACGVIKVFIDDLSTWYVRNSRDNFNEHDENTRKTMYYVLNKLSKIIAPILPFVSERIYQDLNGKENSVHLEKYPKSNEKVIDKHLIEEMQITKDIVSIANRERDKVQIGLKWPLLKATITLPKKIDNPELEEIIKTQINVKNLEFKKGKELNVLLDIKITPELESEGYAREISRKVQAGRKNAGLIKTDKINLNIELDKEFKKIIEGSLDFIKERTNSSEILINDEEGKYQNSFKEIIKKRNLNIHFNKL